jgi:hypothetical protein
VNDFKDYMSYFLAMKNALPLALLVAAEGIPIGLIAHFLQPEQWILFLLSIIGVATSPWVLWKIR